MGKRNGVPYDPKLRQTIHGSKLYTAWKKVRRNPHCEEWDCFLTFYNWAMKCGFAQETWLRRIDKNEPYCPDNCVWQPAATVELEPNTEKKAWADEWNRTVNRIRKHYGMPPLEGTDYADL